MNHISIELYNHKSLTFKYKNPYIIYKPSNIFQKYEFSYSPICPFNPQSLIHIPINFTFCHPTKLSNQPV